MWKLENFSLKWKQMTKIMALKICKNQMFFFSENFNASYFLILD
jgi:hypothetical protein